MSEQTRTHLRQLQDLDSQLAEAMKAVQAFDPRFEEVEAPVLILESDLENTKSRLKEMTIEERRLELAVAEKGERAKRLEERLTMVRNLREEAAVSTELDMVRRALQSDEQEALTLVDQIRRLNERLDEVQAAFTEAQEIVGPARDALIAEREESRQRTTDLQAQRDAFVGSIDPGELRLYEAIRRGGRRIAVAELTEDGACGNCFGVVPLQYQNEVRHGDELIRCEACGVILAAPDPNAPAEAEAEAEAEAQEVEEAPDVESSDEPTDAEQDSAPEAAAEA